MPQSPAAHAEAGRRPSPTRAGVLREKVDAYVALVDQQLQALDAILELTREIAGHTIKKIMAKSDLELGLETLLGTHFGRTDR